MAFQIVSTRKSDGHVMTSDVLFDNEGDARDAASHSKNELWTHEIKEVEKDNRPSIPWTHKHPFKKGD